MNVFDIVSHLRNAGESTMKYHYVATRMAKIKNVKVLSVGENTSQLEYSYVPVECVNTNNHFGEMCGNAYKS